MTKKTGVVTKWRDDKGFGFIEYADGTAFFHISEYRPPRRPSVGDEVAFELTTASDGRKQAAHVQELAFVQRQSTQSKQRRRPQRRPTRLNMLQKIRLMLGMGFYSILVVLTVLGYLNWYVCFWYIMLGAVTFFAYAKDKTAAKQGDWRTPESTLHGFSLMGGWIGAMLAQIYLRHKSRKKSFRLMYYFTIAINLAILATLIAGGGFKQLMS